ncbi:hypothetical protein B0H11DRAFT_2251867 [Mycena galericulata]|nr:hypothetical protein B0H11DRAFT_2251867 [Mycena galericulata]
MCQLRHIRLLQLPPPRSSGRSTTPTTRARKSGKYAAREEAARSTGLGKQIRETSKWGLLLPLNDDLDDHNSCHQAMVGPSQLTSFSKGPWPFRSQMLSMVFTSHSRARCRVNAAVYSGLCKGHVKPMGLTSQQLIAASTTYRCCSCTSCTKVHFSSPMNPLELEIYPQIENVIGGNPMFYEYVFMVDADTAVNQFSVNHLISSMIHELSVSSPGKKGSKLATQVLASEFVLDSLGNASSSIPTSHTPSCSSATAGGCRESKPSTITLSATVSPAHPTASATSIYSLTAGAPREERQHLHLLDKTMYRYLDEHAPRTPRTRVPPTTQCALASSRTIRFSKPHVAQTWQLVTAILHLEFTINRSWNEDVAVVHNADAMTAHPRNEDMIVAA